MKAVIHFGICLVIFCFLFQYSSIDSYAKKTKADVRQKIEDLNSLLRQSEKALEMNDKDEWGRKGKTFGNISAFMKGFGGSNAKQASAYAREANSMLYAPYTASTCDKVNKLIEKTIRYIRYTIDDYETELQSMK